MIAHTRHEVPHGGPRHVDCRMLPKAKTPMKLGLGICARNEEAGIIATLTSVVNSVSSAAYPLNWELVVCANGCTDGTADLIKQWLSKNRSVPVSLELLDTANLVEAQRLIVTRLKDGGSNAFAFFDADIMVDIDCISELLKVFTDDSIQVAYAVSIPIENRRHTIIEKALNLYDSDTNIFSERRHLHGRAFLIKEWSIPVTTPPLVADDIYLSCDLLYKFGPHSIAVSPNAKVYFHQITSLTDYYKAYKRRTTELSKCLQLFPHFRSLPPEQINRRVMWSKLFHETLSISFYWIILLMLRKYSQLRLFLESSLWGGSTEKWKITDTSKKPFHTVPGSLSRLAVERKGSRDPE